MNSIKHIKLFAVSLTLFLFVNQAMSQSLVISGSIKSSADQEALIGASVVELDKDNRVVKGVATDINGKYNIKVINSQNKLSFSYVGYKSTTVEIGGRKTIDILLDPERTELEGIEVVGKKAVSTGFTSIDEKKITTSIQRISAKDLEGVQAASIDEALQGRLAGVDITASSGDPGAGMSIRIRGTTSINSNNKPLIVVDGIPYNTEVDNDFNFATADEEGYAKMLNLAPENISEIVLLKDAASCAVWGSKAANGVLMITTKRGAYGKPQVEFTTRLGFQKQPKQIPMLTGDQYTTMILEGFMNNNGKPLTAASNPDLMYVTSNVNYENYNQNTNWVDAITQTGITRDNNLSVSGGGEKGRYRLSLGYYDNQGTTIGTSLKRITALMNLDYLVSDKITFTTDLTFVRGDQDKNYDKDLRNVAYKKMPNMSVYVRDSAGNNTDVFFSPLTNSQGGYSSTYNPVAMALKGKNNVLNNSITPKFGLRYNILKSLKFNSNIAFDINNEKTKTFLPQEATGKLWYDNAVNRASDKDNNSFVITTINKFVWEPKISEDHNFMMLLSFDSEDKSSASYLSVTSNGANAWLQDPSIDSRIVNGSELGVSSGRSQTRSIAGLILANYDYKGRYIFSSSIRREGNSKYSKKRRWSNYPAVSLRWRIADEAFMKPISFVNDLSLRASYGENGNAPGKSSYSQFSTYGTYNWNYLDEVGVYPKSMELTNLKWESIISQNIGFNLEMFKRITVEFDYYKKRTKDMYIEKLKIPTTTGYSTINLNGGIMDNNGWELLINSNIINIKEQRFRIDFNMNLSKNFNVIRELTDLYNNTRGSMNSNGNYLSMIQLNNPMGSFYGYKYKGVYKDKNATIARDKDGNQIVDINGNPIYTSFFQKYTFQPGDAMYEDLNHDGNIDEYDIVYLGNANPKLIGGFGPSLSYKGIYINSYFVFRYGNNIINQTRMDIEKMYNFDNQSTAVMRRWRQEGDETDIPRALLGGGYNYLGSDRFVEDGTFLRFQSLSINYSFPSELIQKVKIKELKIGVLLRNLYVWTDYLGADPEISTDPDPENLLKMGYDGGRTPKPFEMLFNFNLTF